MQQSQAQSSREQQHSRKAELVLDARAILGEGPCWNAEQQKLYWVDITGGSFSRFDPATGSNETFNIGKPVGAVVCDAADGNAVILATRDGFERYHCVTGELTPIVDPEAHLPENRFNDGKCDSAGRFWAGTMQDVEEDVTGSFYVLDNDLSCSKVHGDVGVSNGIAWSLDESVLYYIDSMKQTVTAFDYDRESGTIRNPRLAIDFQPEEGFPDGMTIDGEGMLWIAHWDGWQVSRWNPATGEKLDSVYVPVAKASSCIFGGDGLETLYITTASIGLTEETRGGEPHAGGLFAWKPGVKGTPTHSFRSDKSFT
ncbi:SMP-30/gluconolactonase/LRE family protein [Paenibacillus montanisoli]|uniref:SMP-30/gluconolactonase/LRE family protein n=1 Tax=Paenibacillus montanisoli TaxID=2081970 RepID=A0A328U4V9_9BACL|nr:SMP-30/gluconolactonase/LRE family protein [Paenibacillus montanisoli]RAP74926.1 SMP-30/gluconolactonase/LRE family protein [Paenibacillus montanisoli]